MISLLGTLNWGRFLARPRLPSPSLAALDALYRAPMMITGAGGSIGSALSQRIAGLSPSELILLDASESRLYELRQDWRTNGTPGGMKTSLGSVNDAGLLQELFGAFRPKIVFHAAAFKHVPLLEEHPLAAITNNIFGTLALVRCAAEHQTRVVLLSTDKAVRPSSIMGATKRVSERLVLASGGVVLRLGNVLATRDSVTETFARQLAAGKPLTVTDPAARRYFLTLDEAVNLLVVAAAEPETSLLLAPELAQPHFITDLAHFMAEELTPERSVELDFVGRRPGDKDVEEFWSETESPRPAQQSGLLSIQSLAMNDAELQEHLESLRSAIEARDLTGALGALVAMVPEYTPSSAVLALAEMRVAS